MAGTIVCGVDGSPGSDAAVACAAALSERLGLRLVLAHVAQGATMNGAEGLTAVQARQGGERLVARALDMFGLRERAERRIELGDPAECLSRLATEEGADVIVLGSRRTGFLRPGLRCDLARRLADETPRPVVVVAAPRADVGAERRAVA